MKRNENNASADRLSSAQVNPTHYATHRRPAGWDQHPVSSKEICSLTGGVSCTEGKKKNQYRPSLNLFKSSELLDAQWTHLVA